MKTWLLLNSIGLAVVGLVLYLVLRQLGFILNRVGPLGARGTAAGPRVSENLSHHMAELLAVGHPSKPKLIIFGAESCSVCAEVKKGAELLARTWRKDAEIMLVYDCENASGGTAIEQIAPGLWFKRDCDLRRVLEATFVPFGLITDRAGTVVGKGLVNGMAHLESLLELEKSAREQAELKGQHLTVEAST